LEKEKRELALGLNEFAGYIAVALVGFLTGYIAAAYGLKPYPFYLGIAFSLLGFIISLVLIKDTTRFTELELRQDMEKQVKEKQQKKQEEGKERARVNEEPTEEKREAILIIT
jgi:mannitol-specific phosphotransferase system IIBC component